MTSENMDMAQEKMMQIIRPDRPDNPRDAIRNQLTGLLNRLETVEAKLKAIDKKLDDAGA